MENPLSPTANKFKAASSIQITATVLWDHAGMLLVDFLDCSDNVTAQHSRGTHGRL
jgi:hypothetical protein